MRVITLLSMSIMLAGIGAVAYAQGRGGGNYNPATETTVTGTLDSVTTFPHQAAALAVYTSLLPRRPGQSRCTSAPRPSWARST